MTSAERVDQMFKLAESLNDSPAPNAGHMQGMALISGGLFAIATSIENLTAEIKKIYEEE